MYEGNDELYSTMFSALKHGARRKILRILSKKSVSFTELLHALGLSSSHLTYHLDALGELIGKDESKYSLSVFGKAAVEMMKNIEDPPASYYSRESSGVLKYVFTIVLTVLVVVSALTMNLMDINAQQDGTLLQQSEQIEALTQELDSYEDISKISVLMKENPSIYMVSKYSLSYTYTKEAQSSSHNPIAVLYVPENNRLLHIDLLLNIPQGLYLPLTIQYGNALEGKTQVKWETEARSTNSGYDIQIAQEGWYTISLIGPINLDLEHKPIIENSGWGSPELWELTDSIRADAEVTFVYNKENVLFGVKLLE